MTTNSRAVTIEISDGDYAVLRSVASAVHATIEDTLAACWKIGASAYIANYLGYELPTSIVDFQPERIAPMWVEWLGHYGRSTDRKEDA